MISLICFSSCNKHDIAPVAMIDVFPSIGDTTLFIEFSAVESTDDRCYTAALKFRWDFNGDGKWDTDYSNENAIAHRYLQPGVFHVIVEVLDPENNSARAKDSVTIFGKNQIETLIDGRDGNQYSIVKINDQWWMAENLRFGISIPPEREQTDNDTTEMYVMRYLDILDTIGGIYLWHEAMNYNVTDPRGICPDNYHIPTQEEWKGLFESYPAPYSIIYYGSNGFSNLNLDLQNGGRRVGLNFEYIDPFWPIETKTGFWSSSYEKENHIFQPYFCFFRSPWAEVTPRKHFEYFQYYSVRCVEDK